MKFQLFATLLLACGIMTLGSCHGKSGVSADNDSTVVENSDSAMAMQPLTIVDVVDNYLVEEFGKQYAQADVCIPLSTVIATDESDEQDIKVWGDFWVFNYQIAGDTLKTASGGSHPGLIHMKKTDKGYEVTGFDQVGSEGNALLRKRLQ